MNSISQLSTTAGDTTTWHVVVERSGISQLHLIRMYTRLPASIVMARIMAMYQGEQPWWSRWLCQPVVEIAAILRVC